MFSLSIHRVDNVHLSPLKTYTTDTGRVFSSQEITFTGENFLGEKKECKFPIYYEGVPAHSLDGVIVSKDPVLLDVDVEEENALEIEVPNA